MSLTGFLIGRLIAEQELKGPTGEITNQAAVDRSAALGLAFGATPIGIIAVREFARQEAASQQPGATPPVVVTVPNVVGQPTDAAIAELTKVGLQPKVENQLQSSAGPTKVARQIPKAESSAVQGSEVVLFVEPVRVEDPDTDLNNSPD